MKIKAFTLIELLVATLIMAMLNITIWQLLRGGMKTYRKAKIMAELEKNARTALDDLSTNYQSYSTYGLPYNSTPAEISTLTFRRYLYSSETSSSQRYMWYGRDDTLGTFNQGMSTTSYAAAESASVPIAQYLQSCAFSFDTAAKSMMVKLVFQYPGVSESWGTLTVSTRLAYRSDATYSGGYGHLTCFYNDIQAADPLGSRFKICRDF